MTKLTKKEKALFAAYERGRAQNCYEKEAVIALKAGPEAWEQFKCGLRSTGMRIKNSD